MLDIVSSIHIQLNDSMDIRPGIFSDGLDNFSIKVKDKKVIEEVEHLYDVMIYDHRTPGNRSVTVAEEGIMTISENKRFLVLRLFNGENYDENFKRKNNNQYPMARTKFKENVIRFDLAQFNLNRTDEELFKSNYKMLNMLDDKVKGLKLGKDYLTKPFEFEELLQRLRNMMMNSDKKEKVSEVQFEIGSYHFDYINQYLEKDGDRQKLTKKEADLLRLLAMLVYFCHPTLDFHLGQSLKKINVKKQSPWLNKASYLVFATV